MPEPGHEYDEVRYEERQGIFKPDDEVIREVQEYCADIAERMEGGGADWTPEEGAHVASLFNQARDPWGLFRFVDEKTGSTSVGYVTRQTRREYFYVLRQMRNTRGSGLFENLRK